MWSGVQGAGLWSVGTVRDAVYVCAWISHLCMHKRVEACVCEMSKCSDGG